MSHSLPKLEVLLLTSYSRLCSLWSATLPAPGMTGGAVWWQTTWSVLEETDSLLAAMWVPFFNILQTYVQHESQPFSHISPSCLLGRLWRSSELSEPWWILGCSWCGELWLKHGLQLPQEAFCLHQGQRLHELDQQSKWKMKSNVCPQELIFSNTFYL